MRRVSGLLSVAAVVLLSLIAIGGGIAVASAQEGSPPPGGFEIAPGVTAEALAFMPGTDAPALYRLTFEAGVTYTFTDSPAVELAYVESGTLVMTLSAPVTINSVDAIDATGEQVAANMEFTVEAGDYLTLPPFTTGEVRNDGDESASVVVADIFPEPAGTPVATPS